jgi:hypothetical protein
MADKTRKKPRISKLAGCIRRTAATATLKRKQMIDSPQFSTDGITPEMSGKFTALIEKIRYLDGIDKRDHGTKFKHFIFTDIREAAYGAKALAAFMVATGFDLRQGQVEKLVKRGGTVIRKKTGATTFLHKDPVAGGCDGFALLQSAPLWKNPMSVAAKKMILRTYNSRPDNVNGELLRIVLLDSKYKEGIDLFDVKYVHLLEPTIASSDLKQAVGRATRYCGQRGLHFIPRRGWPLQVYVYNTELPDSAPFGDGTGQKISAHELMLEKSGIDRALLTLTKELTALAITSAVDYDLNYKINNFDITSALLEVQDAALVAEVQGGGGMGDVVIHDVADLTPELLRKCARRSSKLFPFTRKQLEQGARVLGLKPPRAARRAWYCEALKTTPSYLDHMLGRQQNQLVLFPAPAPTTSLEPSSRKQLLDLKQSVRNLKSMEFDEFQREITTLYVKYKWQSPVVRNGCETTAIVAPGSPVSFTKTQDFVRHYLTPESPFKGLLAWHSVGTGKTCMAVAAATTHFEAAGYSVLWVTRNALMADVYKNIFGSVCSIPIMEKVKAGTVLPTDLPSQKRMLSRAWLPPISYRMFQNALQKKNELGRALYEKSPHDPLHKTILIMDEIHKLMDGDLSASEAADFDVLRNYIWKSYAVSGADSVRPLLMTATPITDSPGDLFEIVNTLIPNESQRLMPFNAFRTEYTSESGHIGPAGRNYFQERAQGLISYLNREYDPTTFAQPDFHNVAVPIGEALIPAVGELVEKCLAGVEIVTNKDTVESCDGLEEERARELAAAPKTAAKTIKAKYAARIKECKARARATLKARKDALKIVLDGAKGCYATQKKLYTVKNKASQLTALESCFGPPTKRKFVERNDFVKEVTRRVTGRRSRQLTLSSMIAVR